MPSCTQPPVIDLTCLLQDQTYLVSGNADLLELDSTRGPQCAAPVPVNASNLIPMSNAAQVAPDGMSGITTCMFGDHTAPSILWVSVDLLYFFWKDRLAFASKFSLNVSFSPECASRFPTLVLLRKSFDRWEALTAMIGFENTIQRQYSRALFPFIKTKIALRIKNAQRGSA